MKETVPSHHATSMGKAVITTLLLEIGADRGIHKNVDIIYLISSDLLHMTLYHTILRNPNIY